MPDEPDAQLLRRFAEAHLPLADAQFVAQVSARLSAAPLLRIGALWSVPGIILRGLRSGIGAPLRLKYAGLMAAVAAAVTLWVSFA
jgi:hypothetical protein